jgi:hypothetical protein
MSLTNQAGLKATCVPAATYGFTAKDTLCIMKSAELYPEKTSVPDRGQGKCKTVFTPHVRREYLFHLQEKLKRNLVIKGSIWR